jgi:hypothetical protein
VLADRDTVIWRRFAGESLALCPLDKVKAYDGGGVPYSAYGIDLRGQRA